MKYGRQRYNLLPLVIQFRKAFCHSCPQMVVLRNLDPGETSTKDRFRRYLGDLLSDCPSNSVGET